MKKLTIVMLLIVLAVLPMFAQGDKETAKTSDGPVVINHWYWVPNADLGRYKELIENFNSTHPGIQVVWENVPKNDVRSKFITAYQVGDGPDSFGMSESWVSEFDAMNMMEPLDTYLASWDGYGDVFPTLWDAGNINGNQYGIPWKLLVTYMYYRADWFKEAGIEVPKTMDDFVKAAKALTGKYTNEAGESVNRYGFGLRGGSGNAQGYYIWTQTYGAKLYDEKGNVAFNSPIAIEATQKYIDLFQKEKVTPPSTVGDGFAEIVGSFKSGKTAMFQHHIGTSVEISEALGDKVGVMLFPSNASGHRWSEGSTIFHGISSISKNKDAAFEFISWMSENEAVEFQSKYLGSIPITKSVSEQEYFSKNQFYSVSSESVAFVGPWPKTVGWSKIVSNTTVKLLQQALMGQITAESMVEQLAEELAK